MTTITQPEIDLFAVDTLTVADVYKYSDYVNSSESTRIEFAQRAETEKNGSNTLTAGIAFAILKNYTLAVELLSKAGDSAIKYIELAYVNKKLGNYDESIANLNAAAKNGADDLDINIAKANALRLKGDFDAAMAQLKACENYKNASAAYHYAMGKCLYKQGMYDEAKANYETAIEIDPNFTKALFHLAFLLDLRGNEEAAIDYYKQLLANCPAYVSALLNLAVLYEDKAKYNKALDCVEQVLMYHPNNARATLFRKDIVSSQNMFYDEEVEKNKSQQNKMLETPVSDFELSVRSRNCLRKMNINTIGDLLRITEAELLAYKNFGETSLNEIKRVLDAKNLRLGLSTDDVDTAQSVSSFEGFSDDIDPELLNKPLNDFELSVRAKKCLEQLNIHTVGVLAAKTEAELLGVKNFGMTSLVEMKQILDSIGLGFRKLE